MHRAQHPVEAPGAQHGLDLRLVPVRLPQLGPGDDAEARELLPALPTAENLMPALDYQSIGRSLLAGPEAQTLHVGQALLPDESDPDGEDPA